MSYVDVPSVSGLGAPGALSQAMQARASMTPEQKMAEQLNRANATMALLLRPLVPAIQRLPDQPGMMAIFKREVGSRPIDALLNLFQPIESLAADIIREANAFSGKMERVIGVPGVNQRPANMAVDQPGDERLGSTYRAFIRRLRIVTNYMILCAYDPVALAVGTAKALFARGQWTKNQLDQFMGSMPNPRAVADAAKAAAEAAAKAAQKALTDGTTTAATQASNTAQAAADSTKRFFGLSGRFAGLGDGGLSAGAAVGGGAATNVAGTGGVTAAGATTGAVLTPELVTLILGLVTSLAPVAAQVAETTVTGARGAMPGQPPPGQQPQGGQDSGQGIPLPLLLVGAGLAFMALKK